MLRLLVRFIIMLSLIIKKFVFIANYLDKTESFSLHCASLCLD